MGEVVVVRLGNRGFQNSPRMGDNNVGAGSRPKARMLGRVIFGTIHNCSFSTLSLYSVVFTLSSIEGDADPDDETKGPPSLASGSGCPSVRPLPATSICLIT